MREGEEVKCLTYFSKYRFVKMYGMFISKVGSHSVGVGGPPQADFVPHIAR